MLIQIHKNLNDLQFLAWHGQTWARLIFSKDSETDFNSQKI